MLQELRIRNFAIIRDQVLSFGPGLNVISGETGAGKSLVLHALNLILGSRARTRFLSTDNEGWEIEALFDLGNLSEDIRRELPEIARQDELAVCRSMNQQGKSRVYINGRIGTLQLLEEITGRLMNICSQNNQVRLLDSHYHLQLVDNFGQDTSALVAYQSVYQRWVQLKNTIERIESESQLNMLKEAELRNIVEELAPLAPFEGVRQSIEELVKRLSNSERLIEKSAVMSALLNEERGVFSLLLELESSLKRMIDTDSSLAELLPILQSGTSELEDFDRQFSAYAQSLEVDEQQLEELRASLAEHARLERKYRKSGKELDALLEQARTELDSVQLAQNLDALKEELAGLRSDLETKARNLRRFRAKVAKKLAKDVERELSEVNMPNTRFEVLFEDSSFSKTGDQHVEFQIETNQGTGLRPMREIASGGELSRIMLVLKKLLRDQSGVNVLIFDEVDSGISGGVARAVGEKLKSLAQNSQVVCITHLAQVASLADHHLFIRKRVLDSQTVSEIECLNAEQRVEEIARMLAGYEITGAIRESARELLAS